MHHSTTVGVDLVKNVIQISVVSGRGKELLNRSFTRKKFAEFLGKQKPALVAFESCATAHYWARAAPPLWRPDRNRGGAVEGTDHHGTAEVRLLRHLPDRAGGTGNIKEAPIKTVEQQGSQAILRARDRLIQECIAQSNHLRGILLEFGIAIPQGFAALLRTLPEVLEDGDNELPDFYRPTLHRMYRRMLELRQDIDEMTREVTELVKNHPVCSRLTAIEGIGPIGAMSLHATLGSGKAFSKGREASAYVGLTPRQYSSGGKANIVGLSKRVGNRKLRSVLIQGALAYVYRMKEPRSGKDLWLKALIERAGPRRAAVALANKNVRTAWALVAQGTEYQRRGQLEMAA